MPSVANSSNVSTPNQTPSKLKGTPVKKTPVKKSPKLTRSRANGKTPAKSSPHVTFKPPLKETPKVHKSSSTSLASEQTKAKLTEIIETLEQTPTAETPKVAKKNHKTPKQEEKQQNSEIKTPKTHKSPAGENSGHVTTKSLSKEDKPSDEVLTKDSAPTTTTPDDLDNDKCLVVKGLNFKVTAADLKKKIPSAKHIRLPTDVKQPSNNKGFALVYFETEEACREAYADLRVNNKILGRLCFVVYFKNLNRNKSDADGNLPQREIDEKMLYVSNFGRGNVSDDEIMALFPDAKLILVSYRRAKITVYAKIKFDDAKLAANYLDREIRIKDTKLNIAYAYKRSAFAQKSIDQNNKINSKSNLNGTASGANASKKTKLGENSENSYVAKKQKLSQKTIENSADSESSSEDELTNENHVKSNAQKIIDNQAESVDELDSDDDDVEDSDDEIEDEDSDESSEE